MDDKLASDIFDKYFNLRKESNSWDYKRELILESKTNKYNLIKDFLAFSNFGGGFILLGIDERDFSLHNQNPIDQAIIGDIIESNLGFNIPFDISYFFKEVNKVYIKVGVIEIYPSKKIFSCPKDFHSDKNKIIIGVGDILTRRNTKSTKVNTEDLQELFLRFSQKITENSYSIDEKLAIYKNSKQEIDFLWSCIENKFDFNAETLSIKFRGIFFHSKYSKIDFANLVGISIEKLDGVLLGNVLPDMEILIRVSKIFDVNMNFFFVPDYFGRTQFWKEDIVRMSILKRVNKIGGITQIDDVERILGTIVYEVAKNIVYFHSFIFEKKMNYSLVADSNVIQEKLENLSREQMSNLIRELSHQYYKILEQVTYESLNDTGFTDIEMLISKWFITNGVYLARIFTESIKKIEIVDNLNIRVEFHFWDEIKNLKVMGRKYDSNNLVLRFTDCKIML